MKKRFDRIYKYLDDRVSGMKEAKKKLAMLGCMYLQRQYVRYGKAEAVDSLSSIIEQLELELVSLKNSYRDTMSEIYDYETELRATMDNKFKSPIERRLKSLKISAENISKKINIVDSELSVNIENYHTKVEQLNSVPDEKVVLPTLNVFLTGPTGSGKTFLVSILAESLDYPFIRIDCSSITQVGYVGIGLDELLINYTKELDRNKGGVILLDEFDKLGHEEHSTHGNTNLSLQFQLLDLVDGLYSHPKVSKYVNNCLILVSGAFSEASKQAKKGKTNIGFMEQPTNKDPINWKKVMVSGGLLPELTGRILDVIETRSLTKEEIREVLLTKKNSALAQFKALMPTVEITQKDIDDLIEQSYNSEFGLRELTTSVYNLFNKKLLDLINNEETLLLEKKGD